MNFMQKIKRLLFKLCSIFTSPIIKIIKIQLLKNRNVYIKYSTQINFKTIFEDKIEIGRDTNVMSSYIGKGTYIRENCIFPNANIGNFCSIGSYSKILIGSHPTSKFVSTHPSFFSPAKQAGFTFVGNKKFEDLKYSDKENKYYITVGNDVWIGENVLIFQGVNIGDGAIIGAGAIVLNDIEPYSINVGVPSRKIKYRFSESQIELLKKSEWWNFDFQKLQSLSSYFDNIDEFISYINKK
jgi:acetyltransferase-like isoleucine patch superfamily enzyme